MLNLVGSSGGRPSLDSVSLSSASHPILHVCLRWQASESFPVCVGSWGQPQLGPAWSLAHGSAAAPVPRELRERCGGMSRISDGSWQWTTDAPIGQAPAPLTNMLTGYWPRTKLPRPSGRYGQTLHWDSQWRFGKSGRYVQTLAGELPHVLGLRGGSGRKPFKYAGQTPRFGKSGWYGQI